MKDLHEEKNNLNNAFEIVFDVITCGDCDENLSGMDSSFLADHKDLFKELWDYDWDEDYYKCKEMNIKNLCDAWFERRIQRATDICQDDKWELENYSSKFYTIWKLSKLRRCING